MSIAQSAAEAQTQVGQLVERFRRNLDAYRRADYKEAQVRVEFIDPFFEALGWDVRNVQGYAEQYKDVVHEDAIKVGGGDRSARLLLPHRRHAQVLPGGQEALGLGQGPTSARPTSCAATPGAPSCPSAS